MARDYVCALCSTRYDYIPPDGCFCSDSATTIIHDGKESAQIREQQRREEQQRQDRLNAKAEQQRKQKPVQPKPKKSNSGSGLGEFLGFLAFLGSGYLLRYEFKFEWLITVIVALIIGVIIRYTYKLIILLILIIVGYYIYDVHIKEDKTSYNYSSADIFITSNSERNIYRNKDKS